MYQRMYQYGKKCDTLIVLLRISGAKAHDRVANQCVYTFAVVKEIILNFVLRDSDDRPAPQSSLTLLERSFLSP